MRKLILKVLKGFTTEKFWKRFNVVIWVYVLAIEVYRRWFGGK